MFGWEFPPFKSGGLGTACYGLTKALSTQGINIIFVIPRAPYNIKGKFVNIILAERYITKHILEIKLPLLLTPYLDSSLYGKLSSKGISGNNKLPNYGRNLMEEVFRYAELAKIIARRFEFDLIHSHDWMGSLAGLAAKRVTGKPLIVHIHATEFDRTGGHPNQRIYDIEREVMRSADKVITVSNFTKRLIVRHYGIAPHKIEVVYNSIQNDIEPYSLSGPVRKPRLAPEDKIVLFLGRITIQKGPGYFLEAAKRVLEFNPNVVFVVAGSGDMTPTMVEKAARLGISNRVIFSGFLRGKEVDTAFKLADVFVMPSVSEPFGITPLEAMKNGTPVIISKQSGVSEVIHHCLKVDFWDTDELANKIIGVLNYRKLHQTMSREGFNEIMKMTWNDSAKRCIEVYKQVLG